MISDFRKVIDAIPDNYKNMKNKLIEKGTNVYGVLLPTKGSFTRLYYSVKNNFFAGSSLSLNMKWNWSEMADIDWKFTVHS